jgi:broad specificity phosphatase PhoE
LISRRTLLLAGIGALAPRAAWPDGAQADAWRRLREGTYVILIRHAATVAGLGDPPGFRLDDCATQRNLSEAGRADARRLGDRFRAERVPVARVYTSPWCRCRETAMLAFGRAEDWEALSSFFDYPHREPEFTELVKRRIGGYGRRPPGGNVVMVTHNVNIAALSKHSVATGEMVLMRPKGCCDARPVERLKA